MYYQQLGALPGDTISDKSAQNFERFPDGRMKWFSGPPLDVLDPAPLDHSLAFLKHKATFKLEEEAAKKSDAKRGSPVKESRSPKKARVSSTFPFVLFNTAHAQNENRRLLRMPRSHLVCHYLHRHRRRPHRPPLLTGHHSQRLLRP